MSPGKEGENSRFWVEGKRLSQISGIQKQNDVILFFKKQRHFVPSLVYVNLALTDHPA